MPPSPQNAANLAEGATLLKAVESALMRGEHQQAAALAETAVKHSPQDPRAWRLYAAALSKGHRRSEAAEAFRQACRLAPNDAVLLNSLGSFHYGMGNYTEAHDAFRRATECNPALIQPWQNLATLLLTQDRLAEAMAAIDRAVALAPKLLSIGMQRSEMLITQGRFDEAIQAYRSMIRDHPQSAWPWYGLSGVKNHRLTASDLRALRALVHAASAADREREALYFAFSRALDAQGLYAEAFAALSTANRLVRQRLPWNAAEFSSKIDAILQAMPQSHSAQNPNQGAEVIFVVSPPRSGSTLVEQILSAHEEVEGAGELSDLEFVIEEENQRRGQAFVEWAGVASARDWHRLGESYLRRTARWREQRPRFTDKMPSNWCLVGAIRAMLPAARVVFCRRDPVEVGMACYRQLFGTSGQPFSYSLNDIAAFWKDYDRSERQWQAQFPGAFRVQSYEKLIADPEREIRDLLAYCGLAFDPRCLQHHNVQRRVRTASASQVREPLRRDTATTARYGALLDPLRAALGRPLFEPTRAMGESVA